MKFRHAIQCLLVMVLLAAMFGCNSTNGTAASSIDYIPADGQDWDVSSPAKQGLDTESVNKLFHNAEDVQTIEGLLVIKNGYLVAEKYYGDGSLEKKPKLQSATKSVVSSLVGIAIEDGYLESTHVKMMDYFPELQSDISDTRKFDITLEHMLQMRAGYPWEESSQELFEILYTGFRPSLLVDVPLIRDPGTSMEYSSLTSHLIGIIVSRSTGQDLLTYANEKLFAPLDIEAGDWIKDWEGHRNGHADLHLRARDMAKFGLLYLNDGVYGGRQVVPSAWVEASLKSYSEDAWKYRVGSNFKDIGYGYQWWSVHSGDQVYSLAWGHGGQQIAIVDELDLVIVVTADPLFAQHGDEAWKYEKQNLNLVADFIKSLPSH